MGVRCTKKEKQSQELNPVTDSFILVILDTGHSSQSRTESVSIQSHVRPGSNRKKKNIQKWTWEQSIKGLGCGPLEHTECYESFKSLPLQNPLSMALPHSRVQGGWGWGLDWDTRLGTARINYASSVSVCRSLVVFSVCECGFVLYRCRGFSPLCRSSPSFMSQHKPVGHTWEQWRGVTGSEPGSQGLTGP